MGLFDEIQKIDEIPDGKPFYLLGFRTRMRNTIYGEKEQFILTVGWDENGTAEQFSGYSAGILSQLSNAEKREFPLLVKLETTPATAGRSGTRRFVPATTEDRQELIAQDEIPF